MSAKVSKSTDVAGLAFSYRPITDQGSIERLKAKLATLATPATSA